MDTIRRCSPADIDRRGMGIKKKEMKFKIDKRQKKEVRKEEEGRCKIKKGF